jgi:iron(III) transport system substrate-binding protein
MTRSASASRLRRWTAFGVTAAVALSACGNDDTAATDTPPAASPASTPADGGEDGGTTASGLDEVCALGAEEGSFSYWATFAEENFARIEEVFASTYPGIDVELLPLRAVESVQRVLTEVSSNVELEVDLINGNLDALQVLGERGLVDESIDWAGLGVKDEWIHETNMVRIYRVPLGISYNTDLTDPADLPDTWEGLVDEKYTAEIIVDPRGNPFSQLGLFWGEDQTIDYVQRLKETTNPVVIEGGTAGMLSVIGGEHMITTGGRDDSRAELEAEGAPVGLKYLDVIPTTDFYNLLIADSAQSNAAACFAGWLMTPEGQEIHTAVEFKANESTPPSAPAGATIVSIETSEDADVVAGIGDQVTDIWTGN